LLSGNLISCAEIVYANEEVQNIVKYVSELDSQIPYTLLAFYPQYVLNDLPQPEENMLRDATKLLKDT
jgi:pyruvate-formate lyase-activating enzyme